MAISKEGLIGPYFFQAYVSSESYIQMLNEFYFPALAARKIPLDSVVFQQDGAPAHCSNRSLELLIAKFGDRLLSRRATDLWPPRSPDLNPCDFYLWGRLKQLVYSTPIPSLEALRERICACAEQLDRSEISRAIDSFPMRLKLLIEHNGGVIESYL